MEPRRVIHYLAVSFLSLITLCGCQDLVPHDTPSLLDPKFHRSDVVGIVAGFGTTFAAVPDLVAMHQATVKCWHEPKDDGNHGCLSGSMGLLRLVDSFATGDRMERGRGVDQFPKCRRVPSFRPQRKSRTQEAAWELRGRRSVSRHVGGSVMRSRHLPACARSGAPLCFMKPFARRKEYLCRSR